MFNMKDAIGWIGDRIAVFAFDGGRVLLDVVSGKKMFVKGGAE
jgi:hypothetical protein